MTADFGPVRRKLDRARHHAAVFAQEVSRVFSEAPILVEASTEPDDWSLTFRCRFTGELDLTPFPLIFGDLLSNLRATLDYAVWHLILGNGVAPSPLNSFPCARTDERWERALQRDLRGLLPDQIDSIRRWQPYADGDARTEPHLLDVLDEVNNRNKHRSLQAAVTTLGYLPFDVDFGRPTTGSERVEFSMNNEPLCDGDQVAHFRFVGFPQPVKVSGSNVLQAQVTFLDDGFDHSQGWGYASADLIELVTRIVDDLDPAVTKPPSSTTIETGRAHTTFEY